MQWLDLAFLIILILVAIPMIKGFVFGAPYVPTPKRAANRMLSLANIKSGEKVMDPGCGDGRLVIEAAKRYGAQAIGYELFMLVYLVAKLKNLLSGSKAKIKFSDSRKADLSDIDVIVCYMLPGPLRKFCQKWSQELKPGTRVVSYAFEIGDWKPVYVQPKCDNLGLARILVYEIGKSDL